MSDCPTTIGSPCPFLPAFFGVLPLFGGALLGGGGALLLGPNDARRMAFFALMAFLMGVATFLDCDMAFLMGVAIVFLAAGFLVAAFLGEPFVLAFRAAGILRRDSTPAGLQAKFKSKRKGWKKKRETLPGAGCPVRRGRRRHSDMGSNGRAWRPASPAALTWRP